MRKRTPDGDQIEAAAAQLLLQAYENHKAHARFQETQRSGFLVAYLGLTGVITASLFNKGLESQTLSDHVRDLFLTAYGFLVLIGICASLAMEKVGIEFRRHFHRAEDIIRETREHLPTDSALRGILSVAEMGTAGDESSGFSRTLAKRLGVSAVHTYLIACVLAGEIAICVGLARREIVWGLFAFPIATLAVTAFLQKYRRIIHKDAFES